jgi:hypothetical protein
MEWSANLLIKHYRHVVIRQAFMNKTRIRFRADFVVDERLFFNKVPSQWEKWKNQGGGLISYKFPPEPFPHEAILFVECPKFIWMMRRAIVNTKDIVVLYEPPTWKPHEEQIARACAGRPQKVLRRHLLNLSDMQLFIGQLPEFTAQRLGALKARSRLEAARLSSFRALTGAGARIPDIHD